MELFLKKQPSLRCVLDVAFPVDVLESCGQDVSVLLLHYYGQLVLYEQPKYVSFDRNILETNPLLFESYTISPASSTVVHETIQAMEKGFFVSAFLDEYYIPGRKSYQDTSFFHGNLLFGYSDASETFSGMAYTASWQYEAAPITVQEYQRALDAEKSYIRAFRVKAPLSFQTNRTYLAYIVHAYFASFDTKSSNTPYAEGLDAVREYAKIFEQSSEFVVCIYRLIEHKRLMEKRLRFLSRTGYWQLKDEDLAEYHSMTERFAKILPLSLAYELSRKEKFLLRMRQYFRENIEQEESYYNRNLRMLKIY